MPRAKPGQRFGGRVKGTPNRLTADIKQMIIDALSAVGGVEYLKRQAQVNSNAFMGLVGKVLPLTVIGDKDNPLEINHSVTPTDQELINRYTQQNKTITHQPTIN